LAWLPPSSTLVETLVKEHPMDYPILLRTGALAGVLATGSVLAQSTPPVVTDLAPPPAEERSSPGALVLDNSLVRAQRDQAFELSAARNGVASIGRGTVRAAMRAQTEADLAQARQNNALELKGRGAGSLVKQ
jgi:hypothetical protein